MSENGLPALVTEDLVDLRPPLGVLRLARHGPDLRLQRSSACGLPKIFECADPTIDLGQDFTRFRTTQAISYQAVDFHRWVADELQRDDVVSANHLNSSFTFSVSPCGPCLGFST